MTDDLVKRLRDTIGLFTQGMDDLTNEAADRIEALERDLQLAQWALFGGNDPLEEITLARNATLEEAARVADDVRTTMDAGTAYWIAAAIRALKEKE